MNGDITQGREFCLAVPSNALELCPHSQEVQSPVFAHACSEYRDHRGNHRCECGFEFPATTFGSLLPR